MTAGWEGDETTSALLGCSANWVPASAGMTSALCGASGARLVIDSGEDGAVSFEDAVEMFISFS